MRFHSSASKKEGYVLLATFIVSALVLTVGLALSKIMATELQFSTDLLFAEKAYFSAESGVEKALIELKKSPINHINITDQHQFFPDQSSTFDLHTHNSVQEKTVIIPGKTNLQFRLKNDTDPTFAEQVVAVTDFDITPSHTDFSWKIRCQTDTSIQSLEKEWNHLRTTKKLSNLRGLFDPGVGLLQDNISVKDFFDTLSPDQKKTCFCTLSNLSTQPLTIILQHDTPFTPPIATVRSSGHSVARSKTIEFDYRQKNLSPFFDFILRAQ